MHFFDVKNFFLIFDLLFKQNNFSTGLQFPVRFTNQGISSKKRPKQSEMISFFGRFLFVFIGKKIKPKYYRYGPFLRRYERFQIHRSFMCFKPRSDCAHRDGTSVCGERTFEIENACSAYYYYYRC